MPKNKKKAKPKGRGKKPPEPPKPVKSQDIIVGWGCLPDDFSEYIY